MATYYVVQTYSVNRQRRIQADEPRLCASEGEAVRLAQRLTDTKFGVVAFSRTGDPKTGDWEDATVLFSFGDATPEDTEELRLNAA